MSEAKGKGHLRLGGGTWLAVVLAVVGLDQASKCAAVCRLTWPGPARVAGPSGAGALGHPEGWRYFWRHAHPAAGESVVVVEGFWRYRYVENPGAAWGFLSRSTSPLRTPFFLAVSLASTAFLVGMYRRSQAGEVRLRTGLALVLGGALGNLIDRSRLGYVIDFIDWHWRQAFTWPTFNLADAAISVGVGLLLLDATLGPRPNAEGRNLSHV